MGASSVDWTERPDLSPRFSGDFGWSGIFDDTMPSTAERVMCFEEAYETTDAEERKEMLPELERAREVARYIAERGRWL